MIRSKKLNQLSHNGKPICFLFTNSNPIQMFSTKLRKGAIIQPNMITIELIAGSCIKLEVLCMVKQTKKRRLHIQAICAVKRSCFIN